MIEALMYCLQAGTVAKGPTALEFVEDVLQPAVEVAESKLAPMLEMGSDGGLKTACLAFMWDKQDIHGA